MIVRKGLLIGVPMLLASLLQLTVLTRLGLPGATPDLVVVTVVAIALAMGPIEGAAAGFAGGILVDLSPSSDSVIGINAILYVAIGFIVGYLIETRDRTTWSTIVFSAFSCAAAALVSAVVDAMLGSPRIIWEAVPVVTLTSALYGALLARVVIPPIVWLVGKLASEALIDA